MSKRKSFEVEKCECDHIAPIDFIHYDEEGCGTCMNCIAKELYELLKAEKAKNKALRSKIKATAKK